jgi:hydroxyacylglutathione hydrolase
VRLYSHFSFESLSNVYLIGPEEPGDAVLVDPLGMDVALLEAIEGHGYYIRHVLVTHSTEAHLKGLRTLRRIYDCAVYAAHASVLGDAAVSLSHGERLDLCCGSIEVIALPGHGSDSVAFHTNGFLFTGTALSAGEYGRVPNPYAKAILIENIRDRVFSLPEQTVLLPFYGPPSTVLVERISAAAETAPTADSP